MMILRKGFHRTINSYSTFYENDRQTPTGLIGCLRERSLTRVFLAGLAFDFCVRYSAEDAQRAGFSILVIEMLPQYRCRRVGGSSAIRFPKPWHPIHRGRRLRVIVDLYRRRQRSEGLS